VQLFKNVPTFFITRRFIYSVHKSPPQVLILSQMNPVHTILCYFFPDSYLIIMTVPYIRWLVAGFPPRRPGFYHKSSNMGFVVDKVALWQVFSQYFGFPCQFSFHQLLHTHLSSGARTIGQLVIDIPSGLGVTQPHKIKKKKLTHNSWLLSYSTHFRRDWRARNSLDFYW
jgi:hypothetical protein